MKFIKHLLYFFVASALLAAMFLSPAHALDEIVRPYTTTRSDGMGGTFVTTGLYDDNFFGNPARVTANPDWVVRLLGINAESTPGTVNTLSSLTGKGNDNLTNLAGHTGENLHGRLETDMPSVYWPNIFGGRNSLAFGLLMSTQFDVDLRNSYNLDPQAITDVGPALTFGHKFLHDESLSVGATAHATYRLATRSDYSFVSLIQGASLSPLQSGGEGGDIDFDLGTTYRLPGQWHGWNFNLGASANNLLGGDYDKFHLKLIHTGIAPPQQPRDYNAGISMSRQSWGPFLSPLFAVELTDIGDNPDGSWLRLLHIGGETHLSILALRAGINQGYWTAGLGLDLKLLQLDFATYGEEMGLNVGDLEDRRYALSISLQI